MLLETNGFRFGEFVLESKERVLSRDGKPVAITPKAFRLLQVLVENHGRLVEKDDLMKAVWGDSYVEEGNLSYTMLLLRKTLGDQKDKPRFIETVPKRGYRFIAEVETGSGDNRSSGEILEKLARPAEKGVALWPRVKNILFPIAVIFLLSLFGLGFWYAKRVDRISSFPILSAPFAVERLSTNGRVYHTAITPDGKNVVYTTETGNKKESLWLRQLESANNIQIIPPSDETYGGLALSPDGNFVYFTRRAKNSEAQFDVYRISIFGGIPTKIIESTQGWLSISFDNRQISFVRCPYRVDENCSLWIADSADGRNERRLVSRPQPFRIGDSVISPDGKSVAFAVGQSRNRANEFSLVEADLESGAERPLSSENFFNIRSLTWLPDKSGLLITASKYPINEFRIWHVSTVTGEVRMLTNDSESYSELSLDKDAKVLISTQFREDKRLHLVDLENPSGPQSLADASKAFFTSHKRILFQSVMSGNHEIWSIGPDGSNLRQLTNDPAEDAGPVCSTSNDLIFFVSNRTGESQVWRMNADGSDQRQITERNGGAPAFVTSDGKWVYYNHGIERTLWRVSTNGGVEERVLNEKTENTALSPDGSQAALIQKEGSERVVRIVSMTNLRIVRTFRPKDGKISPYGLTWAPDGKSVVYAFEKATGQNSLRRQSPTDEDRQHIFETSEDIYSISFAPDGKSIAVVQGRWEHDAVILKGLN